MATEFERPRQHDSDISPMAEFLAMGVKGMILVAFVDDRLDWLERELMVDSLRAGGDYFTAEQVLNFLDVSAHELEVVPESHWSGLFEVGRHMPEEVKRLLLALFIRMGFADGHLSYDENRLICHIADWMEIDQQSREVVRQTALGAIAAAQEGGAKYTGIENLDLRNG
jgi:tellurite resistance protein